MKSRDQKVRDYFTAQSKAYHDKVVDRWLTSLPSEYADFDLQGALIEREWEGRISGPNVRKIRRYLKEPTKFLLLKGSAGLGKSTLAATIGTHLLERGIVKSARYESVPSLLPEISFFMKESDPIGRCSAPDLLVMDDIGAASDAMSATQTRGIWSIINNRWGSDNKPTIITTNMSLTETEHGLSLSEWFGDAAWDRISHDLTYIEFRGESFRLD